MLIPKPLSALHSISIFPDTCWPATKIGSAKDKETLTFGWCGEAFMGSGRVSNAIADSFEAVRTPRVRL
jgi:hypothetical protein